MTTIHFQLGLLKILQCHRGESPDRRGSGGSGRSSSGSADSFQVSIYNLFYFGVLSEIRHSKQFLLWNFHIHLVYSQLFGESFLFLPKNHHQTAVSQPIQQCSIVPKKEQLVGRALKLPWKFFFTITDQGPNKNFVIFL